MISNLPISSRLIAYTYIFIMIAFPYSISFASESFCPDGAQPSPDVIWCDDFEDNIPLTGKYYEFDTDNGDFSRISYESASGQHSLRARWQANEIDAGHLTFNFGRNPIGSQVYQDQDFREIYWRFYMKLQNGFIGYPDKLTRITVFAKPDWSQAMIAHLWANSADRAHLLIEPASGVDANSNLITVGWNDFNNLIWLGPSQGTTALSSGQWYCVEAHVKLDSPGSSDGIEEFWIDDKLEAHLDNLSYVKSWGDYALNSIFFSNYWNQGSPVEQERYLDALVISTKRIGCINSAARPNPPVNVHVE